MPRFLLVVAIAGAAVSLGCAGAAPPTANVPTPTPSGAAAAKTAGAAPTAAAPERAWAKVELAPIDVTFASGPNTLRGVLVKPPGDGPFPTLIWNHGSEHNAVLPKRMAKFWVAQGWAFFMPFRRGHSGSGGTYFLVERDQLDPADRNAWEIGQFEREVDDVVAGAAYLRTQPFVDARRLVVAGGSYGGIETLLVAERGAGFVAALDFAGAAMSWSHNPLLQERLRLAVRRARVPLFFIQAENDYNTDPTAVLSQEAERSGRPFRAKVYPPNGTSHDQGHSLGIARPDVWGPDVLAFLAPLVR